VFIASVQTTGIDTEEYQMALAENIRIGGKDGIDAVLNKYNLDALVVPSEGMATTPPALAGISQFDKVNCRISYRHCPFGCLE
jgi:amidase